MGLHAIDEAKRCLNCKKPRCMEGCPIHTPIPAMIRMFLDGQMTEGALRKRDQRRACAYLLY